MIKITSKFTLPQKLRAHADNVDRGHTPPNEAAWCMRDAANVIEALEQRMIKLENELEDCNYRAQKMGEGRT